MNADRSSDLEIRSTSDEKIEFDPRFTRAIGFARAESLCAKFALYRQKCKGDATEKFLRSLPRGQ
jgi:hypothetical protein